MKRFITQAVFLGYDLLSGNQVSKLEKICKNVNNNLFSRQEEKIKYLRTFGIEQKFEELPIIGKKEVIELSKKINDKLIKSWAYTGGSFGEPLRVPYSKFRNDVRTATFKYFNEKGGYLIGDSFALIRAKDKPGLLKFLRNETIIIPKNVSEKNINLVVDLIVKKNVTVLMGYPTVMHDIAIFLSKHKNRLPINHLISTSEMLDQEKRLYVQEIFDCNFIDRYSNEEVGLIAQQEIFGGDYCVNRFGVYVELLDENNVPVKKGEIGRVVVSDFNNDLIPFLRYDTGDMAVAGDYKKDQLITIQKIIGRTADIILNTDGSPVSSLALGPAIYKPLSNASLITQFQFIQTTKNTYILKLKSGYTEISNNVTTKITNLLKKLLGPGAEILIEFVEDIPPLKSGKRPVYMNLYKRAIK